MTLGLLPLETGGDYTPPGTEDFLWPSLMPGVLPDWVNKPLIQAVIGALLVIILWVVASRKLKVQPTKGQFFAEYLYEFVRNGIARDILHADFRKFLPYLLGLFSFLLVNNWFGQFFYFMYPAFSNVGFAYGLAVLSWLIYVGAGFAKWGFGGFLKRSLVPEGVPGYLLPLVIPLEFLATFITRPITLALRLFANLFAGHLVVMVFVVGGGWLLSQQDNLFYNISGGVSILFSLIIMLLELFIGALQAYIFTVLTAQYVSTSIAEAH
ncbi:F0F1 ATP synthase subunit A [Tessaracoccus lubricantis]|uniref:ATP synthase subunit a n=1 Tax=Tessaracoccus lubricantis TaxID=545543 RepID=A0ABP9FEV1_9ACTN